ncbi:Uncharacterized protein conserved in archaea [Methanocella conradii HZ254]|uniref:Uncharacterized protein conserved in archaea n=1 Tax=Methanocella conradii (strain DSM 24694 / JCM 17849 / CGMCC 1.5162 / HZ254) TaxID=1041930 RepID=H8I4F4_METCZ|nr:DUF2150 family protein [Methanocella conradii]AFC99711.1 Uncharacterized protein conserved in archaea [Methanocella conradii HZ254]MDI6896574.1 DUF2150 family protein [Methanocella conradii]
MLTFYSQERWNNWINQVKESKFKIDPNAEGLGREGIVFLDMEEDVILALCKVTGKLQLGTITKEEAANSIQGMKEIVLAKVEPMDDDKDIMIESVQSALVGAFAAAECFVAGDYDPKQKIEDLVMEAAKAEEAGDMDKAFELMGKAGALILAGKKFDSDKVYEKIPPESFVAEGVDGLDTIAAVLAGGIDYTDEPDEEEE